MLVVIQMAYKQMQHKSLSINAIKDLGTCSFAKSNELRRHDSSNLFYYTQPMHPCTCYFTL